MISSSSFIVGDWTVELDLNQITRGKEQKTLRPQVMELLVYLARRNGQVCLYEDLFNDLWPNKVVSDATLYKCVAELRHQLDECADSPGSIQTIPKKGYRLLLPVSGLDDASSLDQPESPGIETRSISRWTGFIVAGILTLSAGYFLFDKQIDEADQPGGPQTKTSIAVLPFVNVSDDPGNEYFADGISEEILNLLTKVPQLRVTSRSSAFSFKGQNVDVPTMAARLNVAHILEGSVRKSGNQLRITAQLIEVKNDTHLWSETYDRKLENIFVIQDEIAAAVVNALKITLLGENIKATETDPQAYALYLQGRYFRSQNTVDSYEHAEKLLLQAVEIDPGFAPAWSELGNVYANQEMTFGLYTVDEGHRRARHAIEKALEIDPQYGRAWADLGDLELHYSWDFTAADQHMQKALALNPGDTIILGNVAHLDDVLGRFDQSIDRYQQAIALDPLSFRSHTILGRVYYRAGRLEEAAESIQLGMSLMPPGRSPPAYLGLVLLAQRDAQAALVVIEQDRFELRRLTRIAIVQHALGNAEASDAALEDIFECCASSSAFRLAQVHAFRGDADSAFDWLDRAFDNRDTYLPDQLLDPLFTNLHDDPRWPAFLGKMGFPH